MLKEKKKDQFSFSVGGNVATFRIEKGKIILNQDLIQTSTYVLTITTSSTMHTVSKEVRNFSFLCLILKINLTFGHSTLKRQDYIYIHKNF